MDDETVSRVFNEPFFEQHFSLCWLTSWISSLWNVQDKEGFKGAGLGMNTELGDLRSGTSEKMDLTSWLEAYGHRKEAQSWKAVVSLLLKKKKTTKYASFLGWISRIISTLYWYEYLPSTLEQPTFGQPRPSQPTPIGSSSLLSLGFCTRYLRKMLGKEGGNPLF